MRHAEKEGRLEPIDLGNFKDFKKLPDNFVNGFFVFELKGTIFMNASEEPLNCKLGSGGPNDYTIQTADKEIIVSFFFTVWDRRGQGCKKVCIKVFQKLAYFKNITDNFDGLAVVLTV